MKSSLLCLLAATVTVNSQNVPWNDVREYWALHGQVFRQETLGVPPGGAPAPFLFETVVAAQLPGLITTLSVEIPDGRRVQSIVQADGMTYTSVSEYPSADALLAAAPPGEYKFFVVSQVSGSQTSAVTLASGPYPPAPAILSLTGPLDFTQDFALSWNPLAGANDDDRIEISIRDDLGSVVWRFPDVSNGDPLTNGTLTRIVVPADTLVAGTAYEGRIRFVKTLAKNTTSMLGAVGRAARFSETRFTLNASEGTSGPNILVTSLADGAVGQEYSELILASGRRPFSWALQNGSLPRGLRLDPTRGLIEGIPAANGSFQFMVRLQDGGGQAVTQSLALQVTGVLERLEVVTTNLPPPKPHETYLVELEVGGGVEPYAWSIAAGRLPNGLALKDCCGLIGGEVEESGTFPLTIQVTDGAGQVARKDFVLDVAAAALEPLLRIRSFTRSTAGQVRANVTGETDDPITVESSTDMRSWEPILITLRPESGDLVWNEADPTGRFYRARLGHPVPPAKPIQVTPILSTNHWVRSLVTRDGGVLVLTNAAGIIYKLEIPTNALVEPTTITMSLVDRLEQLPFVGGLFGGVDLRPSGLEFLEPATLVVQFPGAVPETATTWAYGRGGSNFQLYPARVSENRLTIPIFHFSGYGQANATSQEESNMAQNPPCPDPFMQELALLVRQHRPNFPPDSDLDALERRWYAQHLLPLAKASIQDENRLPIAIRAFIQSKKTMDLMRLRTDGMWAGYAAKLFGPFSKAYMNAFKKTNRRCREEHKLEEAKRLVMLVKEMTLLDFHDGDLDAVLERISRCYQFELQLESIIEVGAAYEQVRSGRARYRFDFETLRFTLNQNANLSLVSWGIDSANGQRLRPVPIKRTLFADYLDLVYPPSPEGETAPVDECDRKPESYAPPSDILCYFSVSGDPVRGIEVLDDQGQWRAPTTQVPKETYQFWELFFRLAHSKEYGQWPLFSQPEYVGYKIGPGWQMSRGSLYARFTFQGPVIAAAGPVTETTTLDLYHTPRPLKRGE